MPPDRTTQLKNGKDRRPGGWSLYGSVHGLQVTAFVGSLSIAETVLIIRDAVAGVRARAWVAGRLLMLPQHLSIIHPALIPLHPGTMRRGN